MPTLSTRAPVASASGRFALETRRGALHVVDTETGESFGIASTPEVARSSIDSLNRRYAPPPTAAALDIRQLEAVLDASATVRALQAKAPVALRYLEPILAAQGDNADPDLIALQHTLAELLRSPANISP